MPDHRRVACDTPDDPRLVAGRPCQRRRRRDRTLLSEGLRSGRHRSPGNSYFPGLHLLPLVTETRLGQGKGPASSYLAGPRLLYPACVIEPGRSSACRSRLDAQTCCLVGEVSPAQRGFHRPAGETDKSWASRSSTRRSGGQSSRPRRTTAYARRVAPGSTSGRTLTRQVATWSSGSRPTPRPASIRSSTSSRLSMRWTTRGVKPTREARVRTASSSAVLREFTIQSWSAYSARSVALLVRRPVSGTPRPHATSHNGQVTTSSLRDSGARL